MKLFYNITFVHNGKDVDVNVIDDKPSDALNKAYDQLKEKLILLEGGFSGNIKDVFLKSLYAYKIDKD